MRQMNNLDNKVREWMETQGYKRDDDVVDELWKLQIKRAVS